MLVETGSHQHAMPTLPDKREDEALRCDAHAILASVSARDTSQDQNKHDNLPILFRAFTAVGGSISTTCGW